MIELDFAMQKANQLMFGDVALEVIERGGRIWLCDEQIGQALGYARPAASVYQLYKRFADEFQPGMTETLHVRHHGRLRHMRMFTPRGCHLLAMFARTPAAREFRKWLAHVFDEDALRLLPPSPLTPEQQRAVQKKVADRVYELYGGARGQGFAAVYHAIKDAFSVGSYRQVPQAQFDALMEFVAIIEPQPVEMPPQLAQRAAVPAPEAASELPHPYGYLQADWRQDPLWQLIQQQKARGEDVEKYELMYKANRRWMSLASAVLNEVAQHPEDASAAPSFGVNF